MDAYKLLTRSTNLAGKWAIERQQQPSIPSGGEAVNPQLYISRTEQTTDPSIIDSDGVVRGVKRKRTTVDTSTSSSQEVDFFNGLYSSPAPPGKQVSGRGAHAASAGRGLVAPIATEASEPKEDFAHHGHGNLPIDERFRILRSHKVKITQLWAPPLVATHTGISQEGHKRRKKEAKVTRDTDFSKKPQKSKREIVPQPLLSFKELRSRYRISRRLAENIDAQGYSIPTEVQLSSLPLLLDETPLSTAAVERLEDGNIRPAHRKAGTGGLNIDLLSVAPTGSGKTLAFLIPILDAIIAQRASSSNNHESKCISPVVGPGAIVVVPTKELAIQIVNEAKKLTLRTGVRVMLVRKGMTLFEHSPSLDLSIDEPSEITSSCKENISNTKISAVRADILVSTPLTLVNAISTVGGDMKALLSVRFLVLDEADVLLDELFRAQTLKIWLSCTNPKLRVSLWSATMGSSIEDLALSTIEQRWRDLSFHHYDTIDRAPIVRLVVGLKDSAIPNIQHKLIYAATEQGKLMALRQILRPTAPTSENMPRIRPPFLVFVQTIPRAIALHSELLYEIPQEAGGSARISVLHADLSDAARELVMTRFRKGEIWVLITTDLLSRGVDFRGVNGVVNYDFPNSSAAYIHRVGRTGRAGRKGGIAITLYAKEDIPFVKNVANVIAIAERQQGSKAGNAGLQQWLLDAMPKPSKREKQRLKTRGIESRRTGASLGPDGKAVGKARISTKSGYERRVENNRRGLVEATRRRNQHSPQTQDVTDDDDAFGGFDD